MKIKVNKLPKSVVELHITLDEKEFEGYHDKGFKRVQEVVEVDGFRKGNASEDAIVKKYGDMIILEEMANLALRDAYVKAIEDEKLSPITEPKVTITKLAKGNPLELTMTLTLMPEVKLPAYKKLAKEAAASEEGIEVTDKDIETVIDELRKGRAMQHAHEHEEHDHSDPNHTHDVKPEDYPALTDEFAQSFGPDFKTVVDL
jgi:trigger factor